MSPTLHIRLLGEWSLVYGDKPLASVNTARTQSLLAYLVLHRDAQHARRHLAFLFWPDASEAQARNNLRQLFFQLRRAFPNVDHVLYADASTLYCRPDAPLDLDVAGFERAIAAADAAIRDGARAEARAALERAIELYRGDLMPSCYDEWIAPERERLRGQFLRALEELSGILERQRAYAAAIDYAQRLLRHDPLREEAYRRLMRLYALIDDRAAALRVHHTCVTILQRELGVAPGPATRETYERLLGLERLPADPAAAVPALNLAVPLVGREREWDQLQAAWRHAADGAAQFAVVTGEAGIGKSRVAEELLTWAIRQGIATGRTRAYAAEARLAYAPVADWLRSDALRPALRMLDAVWLNEVARLLPELLTERRDLLHLEPLAEHWQRQTFYQALARAVLAVEQPLLLLLDDLQWCDQHTLAWLHYLLRFDRQARLLVVGTVRTDDVGAGHSLATLLSALRGAGQLTEVALGALDMAETSKLAAHVAGCELTDDQRDSVYRQTEGNPLFVVEIVRAGLDTDRDSDMEALIPNPVPASPTSRQRFLPPRVQSVIASRLAQLSEPARELTALAATIGRAFTLDVLTAASDGNEASLVRALDELWQRRIVREQGANAYDFSHDQIRTVAYAEVSAAHRRWLHRRVAQALETVYAADLEPVSAQIAAHYESAGLPEQAIGYYRRAAEVMQRVYANAEAIGLLNKALALLTALPATAERDASELALLTLQGVSLVATRGYAAPEVFAAYSRCRQLCQRLGRPPSPPVLRALAIVFIVRAKFRRAHELSEQLIALAELVNDPVLLVEANHVLGVTLFGQGAFVPARAQLARSLAHYEPERSHDHIVLYAQDPAVICLCRLAFTLWCLGYPDQANEQALEALELAERLGHPFSLAHTLLWNALLHLHRRDGGAAQRHVEAGIAISREHRLGIWLIQDTVLQGWLRAEQGAIEAGIDQMRDGMAVLRATGVEFMRPYFTGLLAEQYGKLGKIERGLTLISEALAAAERTDERWCEAELYRRRGELLVLRGNVGAAEHACKQALAVARYQQAPSLALRAAISLARLRLQQERPQEAVQPLGEIYATFSEGFDTPDLQDARALLDRRS